MAASYALQSNLGSKGKEAQRRLTGDCPEYQSSRPCFLFPALLPRQLARTLRMLLVVATVVTGSRSIQLSSKGRGRRHSSNFRYLANRPPHIFDSGLARNRFMSVRSAFVSTNILLSSACRLCLRQSTFFEDCVRGPTMLMLETHVLEHV